MGSYVCPNAGNERTGCASSFEAEAVEKVSQSAHDVPTADARGQHPTMADQIASVGVPMTREQWDAMAETPNPTWTPTYVRVLIDDPVVHVVATCPSCGTPVKVG